MVPRTRLVAIIVTIVAVVVVGFVAWAVSRLPPPGNPDVTLETVREGLSWPVALGFAPDARVFYAERYTGTIRILGTGTGAGTAFFTIPGVATSGEQGLLGLAVDPNFAQQPYVYAYYTRDDTANGSLYNRIVRIREQGSVGVAMEIVLDRIPGNVVRNGGVIAFGPDEILYAVVGDAQNMGSAQDLSRLSGKVLRMNSDGSAPANNPFVATPGAHPLVYTYGHRNLFGIAFHPTTGRPYVTENGPEDSDEINLLTPGANYGWPNVRGIANQAPYVDPIRAYSPVIVPTNAAFYAANVPAASRNHLIVGSFWDAGLHELTLDADGASVQGETNLASLPQGVLDVEMGPDGFLWVTTSSAVYRIVPVPVVPYGIDGLAGGIILAATCLGSHTSLPLGVPQARFHGPPRKP